MRQIKFKNSGLSLISILIAVSLGVFLIAVMLQIFSANRANYKLAQNLAEMNTVMRYAEIMITDVISQAGYTNPDPGTGELPSKTTVFVPFTTTLSGPGGSAYDTGAYPNSDDPAGVVLSYFPGENVFISEIDPDSNDKIWVKFQGNDAGKIRACNDLYGIVDEVIKVRFYSRTISVSGGDSTTAYYCERQNDNENYVYSDEVTGVEVIPAGLLDSIYIRYGEDVSGSGHIERWSLGADVADRTRVYAVRFAFLLHTRDDVRSEEATQTFDIFGQEVIRTSKKIYKLYMFTVPLTYVDPNLSAAGKYQAAVQKAIYVLNDLGVELEDATVANSFNTSSTSFTYKGVDITADGSLYTSDAFGPGVSGIAIWSDFNGSGVSAYSVRVDNLDGLTSGSNTWVKNGNLSEIICKVDEISSEGVSVCGQRTSGNAVNVPVSYLPPNYDCTTIDASPCW